jgi:hypothetical protein
VLVEVADDVTIVVVAGARMAARGEELHALASAATRTKTMALPRRESRWVESVPVMPSAFSRHSLLALVWVVIECG